MKLQLLQVLDGYSFIGSSIWPEVLIHHGSASTWLKLRFFFPEVHAGGKCPTMKLYWCLFYFSFSLTMSILTGLDHTMQTRLALNKTCLCLPSTRIKSMHHHTWLVLFFETPYLACFVFLDRVLLSCPGWPKTCHAPASASWASGINCMLSPHLINPCS